MWSLETWRSNVRVQWTDNTRTKMKAVYFWEKTIEEGRGTYEAKTEYVISYADNGYIEWIYSSREGASEMGPEHTEHLLEFERRGTKLAPKQQRSLSSYEEAELDDHAAVIRYKS